jgi:hypothetical protein
VLGSGRVVFIAMADTIKSELEQGHSARSIYDRYQTKFDDVLGYVQFCVYVRQLRERTGAGPIIGAPMRQRRSHSAISPPPSEPIQRKMPVKETPATPHSEGMNNVRNRNGKPTFQHHGIVQEGEVEQLFGPGFLPKRG